MKVPPNLANVARVRSQHQGDTRLVLSILYWVLHPSHGGEGEAREGRSINANTS